MMMLRWEQSARDLTAGANGSMYMSRSDLGLRSSRVQSKQKLPRTMMRCQAKVQRKSTSMSPGTIRTVARCKVPASE